MNVDEYIKKLEYRLARATEEYSKSGAGSGKPLAERTSDMSAKDLVFFRRRIERLKKARARLEKELLQVAREVDLYTSTW